MDAQRERDKIARMISPVRSILSVLNRSTVVTENERNLANKANSLIHQLIFQLNGEKSRN